MKLAVMQPYLFPYYGYFQLIHACDTFVSYDDVNYIKQGRINRNNILMGKPLLFTFPLKDASPNKHINEIYLDGIPKKFLKTLQQAYCKAPHYRSVMELMEKILGTEDLLLSRFIHRSLQLVCEYLGLKRRFLLSSDVPKNNSLKGKYKLYSMCKSLGAMTYINSPGGKHLYDAREFTEEGVELLFVQPQPIEYPQFKPPFVPNLSIIDILMFNSVEQTLSLLERYTLCGS